MSATGYLRDNLWIKPTPSAYTPSEIRQYLLAMGYSPLPTEEEIAAGRFPRSVETLEAVMQTMVFGVPFENTSIHYTESRKMDVSPKGLFQRIVVERKGSYCFGRNTLLLEVLRGLGFRAYAGAARGNRNWLKPELGQAYGSHSHMLLFVQPEDGSNATYVVDAGFGLNGPVRPIPLVEGAVVMGVSPAEMHRLGKGTLPKSSLAASLDGDGKGGQLLWGMQVWKGTKATVGQYTEGPWLQQYAFSELECFPEDITDASHVVATTNGFMSQNVVVVKSFRGEGSSDGFGYSVSLFGMEVKKHVGSEVEVLRELKTKEDELLALKDFFGIE